MWPEVINGAPVSRQLSLENRFLKIVVEEFVNLENKNNSKIKYWMSSLYIDKFYPRHELTKSPADI